MFENNPFATHTLEILIMLLGASIIGLWLGWVLWGRLQESLDRLRVDNQSLNVTIDALRQEIDSVKTRAMVAETDNDDLSSQVSNLNRDNNSFREKNGYLETELSDVQSRNRQVETELGLSYTPDTQVSDDIPLEIKEMVMEIPVAAPDFEAPNASISLDLVPEISAEPEPEVLAAPPIEALNFSEAPAVPDMPTPPVLLVEPVSVEAVPQEIIPEPIATTPTVPAPAPAIPAERDDLTVMEGIGPKIQMLLNQYGIYTYQHLAEADVTRLKEILSNAGPQLAMHDPGTWPSQANLAANDQWDTLKSVQGFLKGGKKPE